MGRVPFLVATASAALGHGPDEPAWRRSGQPGHAAGWSNWPTSTTPRARRRRREELTAVA